MPAKKPAANANPMISLVEGQVVTHRRGLPRRGPHSGAAIK